MKLSWVCGTILSTRHLDPFSPLLPSFPGRRGQGGKEKADPWPKGPSSCTYSPNGPEAASASHQSPISSLRSCFRAARAYTISLSEDKGPDRGEREIEKDLHPQGADDDLGWVLYHWDGMGETSCRSGVHMCRDGSHVLMCALCVVLCVCVRLCVCNRFYSDTHSSRRLGESPPPLQHFLLESDKSSRPAGSQRRTGSPCPAVRREMMVRGRTHEHLGRSIWSSLIITVYYHLGWLGGGGSRRWIFGSINFV